MMSFSLIARALIQLLSIACLTSVIQAQQSDARPRNGSVSGRVTIDGQPAANVLVSAMETPANWGSPLPIRLTTDGTVSRTFYKVRADGSGRYQFTGLPPGRYQISAASKTFISANANPRQEIGKTITLDAGESRENVDFLLVRGGVITGRVTDAEGRPVIAHQVTLFRPGQGAQQKAELVEGNFSGGRTDDRGVYRIYGLPSGNYLAGAGFENDSSTVKYPRIYYPDVTDDKQAKVIELKAGNEITGVDIRLAAGKKVYEAIGRVLEAETGKPVPNVSVNCSQIADNEEGESGGDNASNQTDRMGNFRLTGLGRGRYRIGISAEWLETTDFYAEPMTFEITDGNVSGIEVKAARGGVISGVAVIEDSSDPAVKFKLTQSFIYAHTEIQQPANQNDQPISQHQTVIQADGTFRITGIAPGKIRLGVAGVYGSFGGSGRALTFLRMERGGVEVKDFIELAKGEQINNVRLVFVQGSGVIRGQVQIAGGQLPKDWQLSVYARLIKNQSNDGFRAQVDEKGRFVIENLPTGEYEILFGVSSPLPNGPGESHTTLPAKQKVTVTNGSEVQVTIPFDPNRKEQEER